MATKNIKRYISYDAKRCDPRAHREDFHTCPHCDYDLDSEEWYKVAVMLVVAEVFGKHSSLAILSECPKCFENSWVHCELKHLDTLSYLYKFPKAWEEAADKEYDRRHLLAIRELDGALCLSCKHISQLSIGTWCHGRCNLGYGCPTKECAEYEKDS